MKRFIYMVVGILVIGIGVAAFRIASFGVDPFTCMNLGISKFIGMSFGNWQLIANFFLLAVVFFTVRNYIGMGTIVNMVGVGYIADFICWLLETQLSLNMNIALRVGFLVVALLFLSWGAAMYMTADLGISPYDAVAFVIEKVSAGKISFGMGRIFSDITVMTIGILFCILSKNSIWTVAGIGTIINAGINGLLIQKFRSILENGKNW